MKAILRILGLVFLLPVFLSADVPEGRKHPAKTPAAAGKNASCGKTCKCISTIRDMDGDTRILTEAAPDEDRIRMITGGREALRLSPTGFLGLGLRGNDPGEMFHLGDGHLLMEGGGEVALKIKRDAVISGWNGISRPNPMFQIGRIIQAGDGDPEIRFLYSDDQDPEHTVFELDRKGIVASVKQEVGSHFEGFLDQQENPCFRLNSWPAMQLEMGSCHDPVDVFLRRSDPGTLSFLTAGADTLERVRIDGRETAIAGYVKLATVSGAPPAADCGDSAHRGRMKVDSQAGKLWICMDTGWISK